MDQVRRLVENGTILNYDACVNFPQVWGLAAAQKLPGDDAGLNQTRSGLCSNFYKNAYYRGGISAAIDDRKSVDAKEWTPEKRKEYVRIRDDIKANFKNNVAVLTSQAGPAALGYAGVTQQIDTAKSAVDSLTGRLASETNRLNTYVSALQSVQGDKLVEEVSDTEFKIRNLEKENKDYAKIASLRNEQATGLYNKYEGNYHSSMFGYMPLHTSSRSALLTTAIFLGVIALIMIGIKMTEMILHQGGTSMGSVFTAAPAVVSNTAFRAPRVGRAANLSRY